MKGSVGRRDCHIRRSNNAPPERCRRVPTPPGVRTHSLRDRARSRRLAHRSRSLSGVRVRVGVRLGLGLELGLGVGLGSGGLRPGLR